MAVIEYDSYKQKLLAMDETFENLFKALEIEQARQELNRLELEAVQLLAGLLDLQRLEEVFKCFVHRKQLLLVGIVFDHSHGVLSPYFYPSLAEKVYHTHRAKARKIRLSGRKFPWKRPFLPFRR